MPDQIRYPLDGMLSSVGSTPVTSSQAASKRSFLMLYQPYLIRWLTVPYGISAKLYVKGIIVVHAYMCIPQSLRD